MRTLIVLSIVQTVLIGALGVKVLAVDARTARLAEAGVRPPPENISTPTANPFRAPALTAGEVRQIVREEVAASRAQNAPSLAAMETGAAPANIYAGENPFQLKSAVEQDIVRHVKRGQIGEAEMVDLQLKIAALPPTERREMLAKLTRALNEGRLKGQL